jgi:hypothetical protein
MIIQIENLDEALGKRLEEDAVRSGRSISTIVVGLLEREYPSPSSNTQSPPYQDLSDLAGVWTDEDAKEFESNTAHFRQIDEELWK